MAGGPGGLDDQPDAILVAIDPRLDEADLQINMFGWSTFERLRTGMKPHPFSAFTLSPVHLRPEGRGTVRLGAARCGRS